MQHKGTSKIKKNMTLSFEGKLKWLLEYAMALESSRIDCGDNQPRGCLLSAYFYNLFRPPLI